MKWPMLLVAALCCLAAFFGWKTREAWVAPPPAVDNPGRSLKGLRNLDAAVPDPGPSTETAAAIAAVAARPLFRPDRLPFREDVPGIGRNHEAELGRLSMVGVLTFGSQLKGLVVSKGSPYPERWEVGKGDSLQGFKVKEVNEDGIVVSADGEEFHLTLYSGSPSAGTGSLRTEASKRAPTPAAVSASRPAAPAAQTPSFRPRVPPAPGPLRQGTSPARIQPVSEGEDQEENQ